MSSGLWWIFDLILILIVVYVIYSNGKRGFTKVLILCFGYIVTTLLASVISGVAAPLLYDTVGRDNNISGFETVNAHLDFVQIYQTALEEQKYGVKLETDQIKEILTNDDRINFDSNLYHYVNKLNGMPVSTKTEFQRIMLDTFIDAYGKELGERLPKYVQMQMNVLVRDNPQLMRETISDFYDSHLAIYQRAAAAERRFAMQPTAEVLQIFIYFILFSVIMIIIAIFSALLQRRLFFNIKEGTDHAVGAVLGLLEAGAMVILMTLLVRLIVMLTGGQYRLFSEATIENTKIFSFFYNIIPKLL